MIYLASPYSHPDPAIREARHMAACVAAGELMRKGHIVYAPVPHSHHIGLLLNNPVDHEFWMRQCIAMLRLARGMTVLCLDGWRESRGVTAEMNFAVEHGIPIELMEP